MSIDELFETQAYSLHLQLHSGQNLKVGDLNGFSDPYVRAKTNRCSPLVSPIVWKTLNPVWEHTFVFPKFYPGDVLTLDVWDKDTIGKDDFLGQIIFQTNAVDPLQDQQRLVLPLNPRKSTPQKKYKDKGIRGTISFSLSFQPMYNIGASSPSLPSVDFPPLPLRIVLHAASGIKASDWNGKSDPYVKIYVAQTCIVSPVIWKTLNPVWELPFDIPLFSPGQKIRFEVWDRDNISKDDFLGQATIYFTRREPLQDRSHLLLSLKPRKETESHSISGTIDVSLLFDRPPESSSSNSSIPSAPSDETSLACIPIVSSNTRDGDDNHDIPNGDSFESSSTTLQNTNHTDTDETIDILQNQPSCSSSQSVRFDLPLTSAAVDSISIGSRESKHLSCHSLTQLPARLQRISGFNNKDAIDYAALPSFEMHGKNYGVSVPNFRDVGGWPISWRDSATGLMRHGRMKPSKVFRTSAIMRATQFDAHIIMRQLGIKTFFDLRTPDVAGNRGPYLTKFFTVREPPQSGIGTGASSKQKIKPIKATDTQQTLLKTAFQNTRLSPEATANLEAYRRLDEAIFDWAAETEAFSTDDSISWGTLYLHCLIGYSFRKHVVKKAKKSRLISAGLAKTPADQKRAICGPIFDHPDGLEILYRMIIDDCQAEFNLLFHHFLDDAVYPVGFFCNHGKDRTGLTAAFLQLICGVDRAIVIDGYQLSDFFLQPIADIVDDEMIEAGMNPLIMSRTPAWVLTNTLGYINRHYGGVEQYLAICGFDLAKQETLRNRLVEFDTPLTPELIASRQSELLARQAKKMTITIHRAAQLKAADLNGFSDPFIIVQHVSTIPGQPTIVIGQTPIIWTSLDPVWEFTFTYGPVNASSSFIFNVWDYDEMKTNDFLGCSQLYLDESSPFQSIDRLRLDLLPRVNHDDKYVHGYLSLSCQFEI